VESVLLGLAVLACPVGMGLMMWFMMKGQKTDATPSVEALRAEQQRIDAELRRRADVERRAADRVA
jgi:hypothetical protein